MASSYNELFGLGSQHSEDADLEGWWLLQDDDSDTEVDDQSSNANDGTASSNTTDFSVTGPNSYLTKAQHLEDGDDIELPNPGNSLSGFTLLCHVSPPVGGNDYEGDWFGNWSDSDLGTDKLFLVRYQAGSSLQFFVRDSADSAEASATVTKSFTRGQWYQFAAVADGSDLKVGIDGTFGSTSSLSGNYLQSSSEGWQVNDGHDSSSDQSPDGYYAGLAFFSRGLSDAEIAQHRLGPEPIYSSSATWNEDGEYYAGIWGLEAPFSSGSNGGLQYDVVAAKADGTVVDSATDTYDSGTLDLSSAAGETVYLLIRCYNSGGYDIGDYATRTSSYGSADDGYYELLSVTAAGGGTNIPATLAEDTEASSSFSSTATLTSLLTDTTDADDSLSAVGSLSALLSDSSQGSDTFSENATLAATVVQATEASDSWITGAAVVATLTAAAQANGTWSSVADLNTIWTDSATADDLYSVVGSLSVTWTDPTEASDTFLTGSTITALWTDGSQGSDTLTTTAFLTPTLTDGATASDEYSVAATLLAFWNENSEGSDTFTSVVVSAGAIAGTLLAGSQANESFAVTLIGGATLTETTNAADTYETTATLLASLTEASEALDTWFTGGTLPVAWTDGTQAADTVATTALYPATLTETANAGDTLALVLIATATIEESAQATDALSTLSTLVASLSEGAVASDRLYEGALVLFAHLAITDERYRILTTLDERYRHLENLDEGDTP